ncbi:hypothetical protein PpBr36_08733 [Pyricularia pennisetigena]|uniref:hypothetical protein n=1 Tax=Pyricularia pennisetigena TaxID=1578925 RepID=UPI001150A0B9|nr:hypothetical protein PpBr36_08733 [Pyricularia pennisetigena]TLS24540.1 hypothetical protein PpBr36_08733 [Pyricularia pennisetigena]
MNNTIDATDSLDRQHDSNPALLAGLLLPHIVCTFFVAARAWSRLGILRKWFIDDTLIVLAWVISTGVCVVYTLAAETHNIQNAAAKTRNVDADGIHQVAGSGRDGITRQYLFRTYLGLIFYQVCLCLTKFSILSFYLRMFGTWRPLERRLAWATVTFVVAFGIPLLFASIFLCHPATGTSFLVGSPETDKCFPFTPLLIASASLHTTTDAWLIALVVPCVWRLDIAPRQKAALGIVLSLGVFVIAASLTRLQLSLQSNYMPVGGAGNTLGFFVMTILECDVALICASAPTLRPLLARLWPRSGMGDPLVFRRRSRRRNCRYLQRRRRVLENSVNLTSVVSFHGYPWVAKTVNTEPEIRSPSPSPRPDESGPRSGTKRPLALGDLYPPRRPPPDMPVPPVPALTTVHRTPTTLSLKSLVNVVSSRGRAVTVTDAEDGAVLLLGDDGPRPCRAQAWSQSQESFVMGVNDPASPHRTSFGFGGHGGETVAGSVVDVVGGSRPVAREGGNYHDKNGDFGLHMRRHSASAAHQPGRRVGRRGVGEAGTWHG